MMHRRDCFHQHWHTDLPKFHDSGPQFIDVYKALPEHLFAFTFAVYNMYSSGSGSLVSEP